MNDLPRDTDAVPTRTRTQQARHYVFVRHRHNWAQLFKFTLVGGSGYVVNLAVYAVMLHFVNYLVAAVVAFVIAATNNYFWNRLWTFKGSRNNPLQEYWRFLVVGVLALLANLGVLAILMEGFGMDDAFQHSQIVAQAIAIVLVTPINFLGNKLWTFRFRA